MQTNYLENLLLQQGVGLEWSALSLSVNGCLMSNYERYVVLVEEPEGFIHREDVFNLGALNEILRDFPSAIGFTIKWGPGWSIEINEYRRAMWAQYLEDMEDVDLPF